MKKGMKPMRWVYMTGILVAAVMMWIWRRYRQDEVRRLYEKKRGCGVYCCCLRIGSMIKRDGEKERRQLRNLYPSENLKDLLVKKQIRTGSFILFAWLAIHMTGLMTEIFIEEQHYIYDGHLVERQKDDGVSETFTASAYGDSFVIRDMMVEIRDRLLTGEERKNLFDTCEAYVKEMVRGKNASLAEVRHPLNLVTGMPGTSMSVAWDLEKAQHIMPDGSIDSEGLTEKGFKEKVTAILSYGGDTRVTEIEVVIYPEIRTAGEKAEDALMAQIQAANERQTEDVLVLPQEIAGETVKWVETGENLQGKVILVLITGIVVTGIYLNGEEGRKEKKRKTQLLEDYPKFIHKLVLLGSAGLNMRRALETLVMYEKKYSGKQMHYVYEEADAAIRQMQQGIPEVRAYEAFGKNCGEGLYIKLGSMMVQCVRKGASGLNELISGMAAEALMIHRDQIRQKGEVAGTKLLMPMGLILVVVFMILVVPAFLSVNMQGR